jgi:esterase
VRLSHSDLGGERKPPLVILHGLLGSSRNWWGAGKLLASGWHVLALDLRNHGASPRAPGHTIEAMASDVLETIDALRVSKTALLGHSMGGKVAMRLAVEKPDRVERLSVVDTAPTETPAGARELEVLSRLDLDAVTSRKDADAILAREIDDAATRQFLLTNLVIGEDGRASWRVNLPALLAGLPSMRSSNLAPGERYGGPTLFVLGGRSSYTGPEDRAAIVAHFPRARIEVIPESGHNPHTETREKFVETVLAFGKDGGS